MKRIIDASTDCWIMKRVLNSQGYVNMIRLGKTKLAHRMVYEALVGAIPEGMDLDHLCRNRACVNPEHLEIVSRRENLLRGETSAASFASRSSCKNGHPFTVRNTAKYKRTGEARICLECAKISSQRARDRKKNENARRPT